MNLSAPKQVTWIIALVVGLIGVVGNLVPSLGLGGLAFWLVVAALALMLAATWVSSL
jgi:hypothetical protein